MLGSIIADTADFVRKRLADEATGHDWWHTERVYRLAHRMAELEGADVLVVGLAALLHDIADWKFSGDEHASARLAAEWLSSHGVEASVVEHVAHIIDTLSFKSVDQRRMATLEGQVVQDADRLDALGAIGIARVFAYGGWKGTPIHDPDKLPRQGMTAEEYRAHQGTSINHFYEKLLHLRHLMNTATARQLAEERHAFMEAYLARFYTEWAGEA